LRGPASGRLDGCFGRQDGNELVIEVATIR
jgi:hypothetical protein